MRVIAAYLLAQLGGNASPSLGDIEKILSSVGITLEDDVKERAEKLITELNGKELSEVIAAGEEKLASAPVALLGGAPAAGGGAAAASGDAAPAEEAAPAAEPSESDEEMGMDLFGGDDDY
uniref:60S acidic ribosomal protein P2 n=1 Tax=Paramoeba aestuarina TaxID=180227 RepID=A0A7S4N9R8_9EUKA|mmetsp:Transcript_13308/g.20537  ORF Transcript_13308/g.20537 Transcript_13308/m.20537 type:complete len:121 (+) Transcript_13308:61-423(+)